MIDFEGYLAKKYCDQFWFFFGDGFCVGKLSCQDRGEWSGLYVPLLLKAITIVNDLETALANGSARLLLTEDRAARHPW